MRQLNKALQAWRGPGVILNALQQDGYGAHSVYRRCIHEFCDLKCLQGDIEEYWEESAKEYISSGGADFDIGAHRNANGYYRSKYIDDLISKSAAISTKFPKLPSVHPCIHAFMSEIEFENHELYRKIRIIVEETKNGEFLSKQIPAYAWDGSINNLLIIFDSVSNGHGFNIIDSSKTANGLVVNRRGLLSDGGLLFYCNIDVGVREPIGVQLPIEFRIGYRYPGQNDFFIGDLRYIIPGIEQYSYYAGNESAVIGMYALLCAFAALVRSF